MVTIKRFAQGDVLIERLTWPKLSSGAARVAKDADGAVVLGRGELSGHRHAVYSGAELYREPHAVTRIPRELYVGHLVVTGEEGAELRHEKHGTIKLAKGVYCVRRQRRCMGEAALARAAMD